jgi:L-aminopeptidase/D-esterase-like protein
MAGHGGISRALDPTHTLVDGDTVFVLATGQVPVPAEALLPLQAAAASAVTLAVLDGVLAATATRTPAIDVPAYADLAYAP